MAHTIRLPRNLRKYTHCGHRQSGCTYRCNRPEGHSGRHLFYHRHIDGRVRGVWA